MAVQGLGDMKEEHKGLAILTFAVLVWILVFRCAMSYTPTTSEVIEESEVMVFYDYVDSTTIGTTTDLEDTLNIEWGPTEFHTRYE